MICFVMLFLLLVIVVVIVCNSLLKVVMLVGEVVGIDRLVFCIVNFFEIKDFVFLLFLYNGLCVRMNLNLLEFFKNL